MWETSVKPSVRRVAKKGLVGLLIDMHDQILITASFLASSFDIIQLTIVTVETSHRVSSLDVEPRS